jgi:hypothetical protein
MANLSRRPRAHCPRIESRVPPQDFVVGACALRSRNWTKVPRARRDNFYREARMAVPAVSLLNVSLVAGDIGRRACVRGARRITQRFELTYDPSSHQIDHREQDDRA